MSERLTFRHSPPWQGNVLYWWIGLQDLNSTENPVIQPVLSFLNNTWRGRPRV